MTPLCQPPHFSTTKWKLNSPGSKQCQRTPVKRKTWSAGGENRLFRAVRKLEPEVLRGFLLLMSPRCRCTFGVRVSEGGAVEGSVFVL